MQAAVPELMDLAGESARPRRNCTDSTRSMAPRGFSPAECLLARRLVERGVRFVELTCPAVSGDRWDQHGNLKEGHENNARAVDQPIAGLLRDLSSAGPAG